MPETIGMIGLGNMGVPIAHNLLRRGYNVRAWNRTPGKAAGLAEQGAVIVDDSSAVATPGGIVCTMVTEDKALEAVCTGANSFVEKLGPGGIHVSMSTILPATSRSLAEHHARYGVSYVAAPVFGRPDAAAAKKLWVCLSGPETAKRRVEPMLASLGQGNFDFGEDAGSANVAKLCGNFMIVAAMEALGEALVLAEKNGVSRTDVANMLSSTMFACTIYQGYGKRIAENQYEPAGFPLGLGLKDIRLILKTAVDSLTPMPIATMARDRFISGIAKGRQNLDWGAIALGASDDAGLKVK